MTRTKFTLFALTSLGALLAACGPDDTSGSGGSGGGGGSSSQSTSTTSTSTTSSSSTSTSGSGGGSATGAEVKVLVPFDPAKGELPEGLILSPDGTAAYTAFAPTGKVVKISLADNTVSDFGAVPAPPANGGFVLGLAFDSAGDLYVGVASFLNPGMYQAGVYKIPKTGGDGTLFSKAAAITFANGLVFDKQDNLYLSESPSGTIYKIDKTGLAKVWSADPLLTGGAGGPCASGQMFAIGPNGVALVGSDLFTVNTDKASLIKIPINMDGTAGMATEVIKTDCANLGGADGLYADTDGSLIVADNATNQLVRVGTDGKPSVIVKSDLFNFPTSAVPGTVGGKKYVYVVNAAFAPAADSKQHPALLSYGPLP